MTTENKQPDDLTPIQQVSSQDVDAEVVQMVDQEFWYLLDTMPRATTQQATTGDERAAFINGLSRTQCNAIEYFVTQMRGVDSAAYVDMFDAFRDYINSLVGPVDARAAAPQAVPSTVAGKAVGVMSTFSGKHGMTWLIDPATLPEGTKIYAALTEAPQAVTLSDERDLLRKFLEYADSEYVPNTLFERARALLDAHPTEQRMSDAEDAARLDWLREECCDLRSISVPTGGDDADVNWIVIQHHMAEPREREIGRGFSDDPRDAIDAARKGDSQ